MPAILELQTRNQHLLPPQPPHLPMGVGTPPSDFRFSSMGEDSPGIQVTPLQSHQGQASSKCPDSNNDGKAGGQQLQPNWGGRTGNGSGHNRADISPGQVSALF